MLITLLPACHLGPPQSLGCSFQKVTASLSRLQAESLQFKWMCLGYSLENVPEDVTGMSATTEHRIELLAEAEHQRWMTEKKLQGWTYGVPRDDRLKHHPYAELLDVEREKDREMWRLLAVK